MAAGCVRMLRPGGTLTLIHRAERVGEILAGLAEAVGDLVVFPLWPGDPRRPANACWCRAARARARRSG